VIVLVSEFACSLLCLLVRYIVCVCVVRVCVCVCVYSCAVLSVKIDFVAVCDKITDKSGHSFEVGNGTSSNY